MHKIKTVAVSEGGEVGAKRADGKRGFQGEQGLQAEDGIIQIAPPGTILESAVGGLFAQNEIADEPRRSAEQPGRAPRHTDHFQPQRNSSEKKPPEGR